MTHKATRQIRQLAVSAAMVLGFASTWAAQAGELPPQVQKIDWTSGPPALTEFKGFDDLGGTLKLTDVILSWGLGLEVDLESRGSDCALIPDCKGDYTWIFAGYSDAFVYADSFFELSQDTGFTNSKESPKINDLVFSSDGSIELPNLDDFLGTGSIGMVQNTWGTPLTGVTTTAQRLAGEDPENPDVEGTISLTYVWEEKTVPTPSTIALLGLGLAGIGVWRRKAA